MLQKDSYKRDTEDHPNSKSYQDTDLMINDDSYASLDGHMNFIRPYIYALTFPISVSHEFHIHFVLLLRLRLVTLFIRIFSSPAFNSYY